MSARLSTPLGSAIFAASFIALSACSAGRVLRPVDPPTLHTDEALVLLSGAPPTGRLEVTLCTHGDLSSCITLGVSSEDTLAVGAVRAGLVCINSFGLDAGAGVHYDVPPERAQCFEARSGRIAFPGRFEMSSKAYGNTSWSSGNWRFRPHATVRDELDARFPLLRDTEMDDVRTVAMNDPDRE